MLHQHILETERLILTAPKLEDAAAIKAIINHPEISRYMLNIPYPYPDNGVEEWVHRLQAQEEIRYSFMICRKTDNVIVGACNLHRDSQHLRAELGYWMGVDYWGQGYVTEAAKRVIQFGFEELGLVRIDAGYFTDNPASRRVMDKLGMQYEGTFRSYVQKDGVNKDLGYCAILREDWENGSK